MPAVQPIVAAPSRDLATLVAQLHSHRHCVPLAELERLLAGLRLDAEELAPFRRFNRDGYRRNLIACGDAFEALLLCWRPGQRSPIHDHRGSACAVRVVEGAATETVFMPAGELAAYPVSQRRLDTGHLCANRDADVHEVANLEPVDLVTLHVYSPPLTRMRTYTAVPRPLVARRRRAVAAPPA